MQTEIHVIKYRVLLRKRPSYFKSVWQYVRQINESVGKRLDDAISRFVD